MMLWMKNGAGVHKHAKAVASTWQSCFQFICGEQFCRQINLEKPFLIEIQPSKKKIADIEKKEFKISMCHDLAEQIGLPLLRDRFSKVYPYRNFIRVRVTGSRGIIQFHQLYTSQLRQSNPEWANQFYWPDRPYAN
jgi:hypothetical protein